MTMIQTVEEDLVCQVNATFLKTWYWYTVTDPDDPEETPIAVDTNGWSGKAQIRYAVRGQILHECNTENEGLRFDNGPIEGRVEMYIPRIVTNTFKLADLVYDIVVFDLLDNARRFSEGQFVIVDAVTLGAVGEPF